MSISSIEYYSRASRFIDYNILQFKYAIEFGVEKEIIDSFGDALSKYWIYSIIGPRFDEIISRFEFIPFFIEGFFIFIFSFLTYLYAIKVKISKIMNFRLLFFYCLIPSLVLITLVHTPFGILNLGTGIRWRVNFETIFYLTPLLIFNYKDFKIK